MKKFITISLLLLSLPVQADKELTGLQIASNIGLVVDWAQTREIAVNDDYLETNPVLGSRPTTGDVNRYFVGVILLNNIIGEVLPKPLAKTWYGSITLIQMNAVRHNYSIGIDMRF